MEYLFFTLVYIDVHAKDLVTMPQKPEKETTRRPAKKVPSWHLTNQKTLNYIQEADDKKKAEKKKQDKYDKAKKEAVDKVKKKEERKASKSIKVVTRLFKPVPKPKRVKRVR